MFLGETIYYFFETNYFNLILIFIIGEKIIIIIRDNSRLNSKCSVWKFISEPPGSNDFQKDYQWISARRAKKKIPSIRGILGVASVSLRRRARVQA